MLEWTPGVASSPVPARVMASSPCQPVTTRSQAMINGRPRHATLAWSHTIMAMVWTSPPTVLSASALLRALSRAPGVTSLSLGKRAVDFYNDQFLPSLRSACPKLTCLSISEPRFTGAPPFKIGLESLEGFFHGSGWRLQELSLSHCLELTELPAAISSLTSLRVLLLHSNVLNQLPDGISHLPALQELHLNCPALRELPETFGQLKSLAHISFSEFRDLRRLPESFGDLSSLISLKIDGSWHLKFPDSIGALQRLQQMRRLELRCYEGEFPEACEITLEQCRFLRNLPPTWFETLTRLTIHHCANLEPLSVDYIGHALALRHLTIHGAHGGVALEPLSRLTSLERLEVSDGNSYFPLGRCEDVDFPVGLFSLPSLAYVKLGRVIWLERGQQEGQEGDVRWGSQLCYPSLALASQTAAAAAATAAAATAPAAPPAAAALAGAAAAVADAAAAAAAAAATAAAAAITYVAACSSLGPSLQHLEFGTGHHSSKDNYLSARLFSLRSLTHLSISKLQPCALRLCAFGLLTNLRSLSLSGSFLPLPDSLSLLAPSLHSLSLEHNECISSSIIPSSDPSSGGADRNRLAVPSFIAHLTSLTALRLTNIDFPSPPPDPAILASLRTLRIRKYTYILESEVSRPQNQVHRPESIGRLAALEWLELNCSCSNGALPDSLGGLGSLNKLHLQCGNLEWLPEGIHQLICLEELELRGCHKMEHLQPEFGFFGALKKLTIEAFSSLPDTLGGLSLLEVATLARGTLTSLPPSFCLLSRLHTLTIAHCDYMITLPTAFGALCSLERLSFISCRDIQSLPDSSLSSLIHLAITECYDFSTLPETFGSLPRVARLTIAGCHSFTHLPASFSSLPSLRVACFNRCKHLRSLPPDMGLLPRLEVLQLRGCVALETLPDSLRQAGALRHVDVHGSGVVEGGEVDLWDGARVYVVGGKRERGLGDMSNSSSSSF
ncbi:hypothetical protein CLOP_g911 [Closterium sp. NIES-67]|nr:hypothetical protein CLOP_g911 [Closterium sp. NIES-67]